MKIKKPMLTTEDELITLMIDKEIERMNVKLAKKLFPDDDLKLALSKVEDIHNFLDKQVKFYMDELFERMPEVSNCGFEKSKTETAVSHKEDNTL